MGMKYCKRKIPRLRKFFLKVVFSFPVIRENQDKLRKRNVECGEIQLHYICLGQILKLEIFKKFYKLTYRNWLFIIAVSLSVSLRDNHSVFSFLS